VKVLALDYGSARTGVAVSDATGTVARPLGVVEQAATGEGIRRLVEIAAREDAQEIVVGLPLTLRGERGEQAEETERFVGLLREALDVPVATFDERFTTDLAESAPTRAEEDAVAAAHLLSSYLTWKSAQPT
jgi:putative Holliday junction resolvase